MSKKDYQSLSNQYRLMGKGSLTQAEVAAYLIGRMPATKAAIQRVLEEVGVPVERFLDLGAGPGTGLLAALEVFDGLTQAVLVESNPHMISVGKERAPARWVETDLFCFEPEETDCALFGYSYGELDPKRRLDLLKRVFTKTRVVVVVEPGTPRGYANVLEARDFLLGEGGQMVAPCPHSRPCPMQGGDWCHFSVRVPRSKEHKAVKGAELSYEDEKFSYVVISKEFAHMAGGRILRRPLKQKGRVVLRICGDEGIEEKTVSKKAGAEYRLARKAKWGGQLLSPKGKSL